MRKILLIMSLAGLTVLASASDGFAQRRGYGGGWGYTPGFSFSVGRGGYYSPYGYYGDRGYSSPYYRGYGYSYVPSYNFGATSYSSPAFYSEPAFPSPQIRQSYYTAPATTQQSVVVTVLVPAADTQVWIDNGATTLQGMERLFQSPPLEQGHNFTYTIKARWMENGQAVTRERQVNFQAGQSITVNFRENTRENVAPPLPRLQNPNPGY